MKEYDTIDSLGLDVKFEAEWYGEDEYLQNCKVTIGDHLFEGSSVVDKDLSTKAFHISEDKATHLFTLWLGAENGDVVVGGEVHDNPFFDEDELKDASFGSGWNESKPGKDGVEKASKDADGAFLFMAMENSDFGRSEYDLESIEVVVYEGGDRAASFEQGYF